MDQTKSSRRIPWGVFGTLLFLALTLVAARYTVKNFRRPGSMSVLEAQGMDMSVMRPPLGAMSVAVVTARRGALNQQVSYTGSVVAWSEQEIAARVTGRLLSLPVYPGSTIRHGQLLARLDSEELRTRENEARFASEAAAQENLVAGAEENQAKAERAAAEAQAKRESETVRQAQANLAGAQAAVREEAHGVETARAQIQDALAAQEAAQRAVTGAQADATAAEREVQTRQSSIADAQATIEEAKAAIEDANAEVETAKTRVPRAQADLEAAQAEAQFAEAKAKRSAGLLAKGFIAAQQAERDEADAHHAHAAIQRAQSAIEESQSQISAAQAVARQRQATLRQMQARLTVAQSDLETTKAKATAANAKVAQMEAEADRAAASIKVRRTEAQAQAARVQRMQADVLTATAQIEQAKAGSEASLNQAHGAAAGVTKARLAQSKAALMTRQAEAALSTTRVVRGYTEIRAQTDGVVTERVLAPGSLVSEGAVILRVAQTNPVRFQANVAQVDFSTLRPGMPVTIRVPGATQKRLQTVISAVFPAASAQSRTGIIEAIAPNDSDIFKPGEAIVMDIAQASRRGALKIPSAAIVQVENGDGDIIASRQIAAVWTLAEAAKATQPVYTCTMHPQIREDHPGLCPICQMKLTPLVLGSKYHAHQIRVQTGASDGNYTEILSGLPDGAQVIYKGQEALTEGEPVMPTNEAIEGNPKSPQLAAKAPIPSATSSPSTTSSGVSSAQGVQTVAIRVSATGFSPSVVNLKAGQPTRLIFTRVEEGCGTEVVFPDLKITKKLPLNQAVSVDITPKAGQSLSFACGMNMFKGQVLVR